MESEKLVGKVSHFFDQAMVAAIKLESALAVGDQIKIQKGDDDPVEMIIGSMQLDHKDVDAGRGNDEIAIKVDERVKEGADVFKVKKSSE